MNIKKRCMTSFALILVLSLVMTISGMAAGPVQPVDMSQSDINGLTAASGPALPVSAGSQPGNDAADSVVSEADLPDLVIDVSTVDELLAAIGPDRAIRLADGVYNLTAAASYAQSVDSACWYWDYAYDGYQLKVFGADRLMILGNGADRCSIVTEPRYANVLTFAGCNDLSLFGLNIGHTTSQGYCSGGVLNFDNCTRVAVHACDLYGCGTEGITAFGCSDLFVSGTTIRDCTYGGIEAYSCRNVRFVGGIITGCGISRDPEHADGWTGFNLIYANDCSGFALLNTEISGNVIQTLFAGDVSTDYYVLGCEIRDNTIGERYFGTDENGTGYSYDFGSVFELAGGWLVFDQSSFSGNIVNVSWIRSEEGGTPNPVRNLSGSPLDQASIETMARSTFPAEELDTLIPAGIDSGAEAFFAADDLSALREVHVTTVDEFLAAIGDSTIIHVETGLLDFSTASNYGVSGGDHYYWMETWDGPGLVITGVSNLYILGQGRDQTTLQAVPRYADVLYFDTCRNIGLVSLTAGHMKEAAGSCSGDVFEFLDCYGVTITDCGLFGCGVTGIVAGRCSNFRLLDTEIYDCSWYGVQLDTCTDFRFERCSVHDCSINSVRLSDSRSILWDGTDLRNGENPV